MNRYYAELSTVGGNIIASDCEVMLLDYMDRDLSLGAPGKVIVPIDKFVEGGQQYFLNMHDGPRQRIRLLEIRDDRSSGVHEIEFEPVVEAEESDEDWDEYPPLE